MGNAVPGLVLGILIGKGVEESGWNRVTKVMMVAIVALFVLSGFFRGFDMKMIESFHLTVPNWLDMIHNSPAASNGSRIMEQNKGFGMPTGRSRSLLACSPPASSPGPTCTTCTASAPLTK